MIGSCTCPVGAQCKHVAAVLLAALVRDQQAARAGGTAVPAWERVMTALVTQEPAGGERPVPLGLQFDLVTASIGRGARHDRVRLRPVVPGRSSTWVRSGITWRGLQYDVGPRPYDPAQRDALGELYLAFQAAGRGYWSGSGDAVRGMAAGWHLLPHAASACAVAAAWLCLRSG